MGFLFVLSEPGAEIRGERFGMVEGTRMHPKALWMPFPSFVHGPSQEVRTEAPAHEPGLQPKIRELDVRLVSTIELRIPRHDTSQFQKVDFDLFAPDDLLEFLGRQLVSIRPAPIRPHFVVQLQIKRHRRPAKNDRCAFGSGYFLGGWWRLQHLQIVGRDLFRSGSGRHEARK